MGRRGAPILASAQRVVGARRAPFLVEFQSFSKQNLGKLLRILRVSAPNNFPRPIVWAAQILPHQAHPCPSRLAKFYASSIC
jgi:hypothetical protein